MNSKGYTYDNALLLKDAGAVTTSAAGTVSGSAKVLDLGAGRVDGRTIINMTAFDATTGDERSQVTMQFSASSTFASGVVNGPSIGFGDATVLGTSADPAAGVYELPWTNEVAGTVYRYARIYTYGGGTSPSVTFSAHAVLKAA